MWKKFILANRYAMASGIIFFCKTSFLSPFLLRPCNLNSAPDKIAFAASETHLPIPVNTQNNSLLQISQ